LSRPQSPATVPGGSRQAIEEDEVFEGGSGKGSAGHGDVLRPADLKWKGKDLLPAEGTKTWVLSLPDKGMRSRPVVIKVEHGRPSPSTIVFEMHEDK
jgi:hypothetical protein